MMNADRHLLFGLLALQNEFIDRGQLVAAFGIWIADHCTPLDEILVQQDALSVDDRALLSRLVDRHVAARGGDLAASLRSISSAGSVRDELERLADNEIHASVAKLQPVEFVTIAPSVGQSTSAGQRFEIRRPLDRGGLGIVSIAVDKELNREVALKEILGDHADDHAYRSKFLLEAEITGGLEHPGIVPVYGLGTGPDGRPYYAMRLIKGDNLLVHIRRFHENVVGDQEPFDGPALRRLLRRFLDVCQAIDYAHARGVLHRDLKPGNVMLGKYGETLVVDWGLAKPLGAQRREYSMRDVDPEPSLIPSGSGDGMTIQGSIVGTAAYAPPEQLSGNLDAVNQRSDVYGLGAILYELLTGRPPAQGETLEAIVKTVIAGDIKSARTVQPNAPKPLEAICQRAIARRPEARYATAAELGQEIERWLDDLPVHAFPEPLQIRAGRWVRSHQLLVSTSVAVVLMFTLGLGLFSSIMGRNNLRLTAANKREKELRLTAIAETEKAQAAESKAADLLGNLTEQTLEASQALLHYGVSEYRNHRIESAADQLIRAWRLRSESDPLKKGYGRILASHLTQGGRSWAAMRHEEAVSQVAFSLDGTRVATTSGHVTQIWDATTGTPLGASLKHDAYGNHVAFSQDRGRIATASGHTAQIRDAMTGERLGEPVQHESRVNHVALSPDGTRLATVSDQTTQIWDAMTGRPLGKPLQHETYVSELAFNPNGTRVATASGSEIQLWDAAAGTPLGKPLQHENHVNYVAFSPDGTRVATACWDCIVRIWDATTGTPIGEPLEHESYVTDVAFSPDGTRVATASGHTTRISDAITGTPLGEPLQHESDVTNVAFSPDGTRVATASRDDTVRFWDTMSGVQVGQPLRHNDDISCVAFSPDGTRVATASRDRTARIWNVPANASLINVMYHQQNINLVTFSADGTRFATASDDHTARLWDAQTGMPLSEPLQHDEPVVFASFSPEGARLATKTRDRTTRIWDAQTGAPQGESIRNEVGSNVMFNPELTCFVTASDEVRAHNALTGAMLEVRIRPDSVATSVTFSIDGRWLATTSCNPTAQIWDVLTGAPVGQPIQHRAMVNCVAFSSDKIRMATASDDGTARIWDIKTGSPVCEPMRHDDAVNLTAFSPDGSCLVTTTVDSVYLWDTQTYALLGEPMQHEGVVDVAFSADGTRLATASANKTVRVWDTLYGGPIGELIQHDSNDNAVAFSPDGLKLVTVSNEKTARLWDIETLLPEDQKDLSALINRVWRKTDAPISFGVNFQTELDRLQMRRNMRFRAATSRKAIADRNWFAAAFHLCWLREQSPNEVCWHSMLAQCYSEQGKWAGATLCAERAVEMQPTRETNRVAFLCSLAHGEGDRIERSLDRYLAFANASDSLDVRAELTADVSLFATANLPWSDIESRAHLALAAALKPKSPLNAASFFDSRGGALYRMGRLDNARSVLNAGIQYSKNHPDPGLQTFTGDDPRNEVVIATVHGSFHAHAFLAMIYHRLNLLDKSEVHRQCMARIQAESPSTEWQERLRRKLLNDEVSLVCKVDSESDEPAK